MYLILFTTSYIRGRQPRDFFRDFATLNAQGTRHGARPEPKLSLWCTGAPPACPADESLRQDQWAPKNSVQIFILKPIYT